MPLFRTYQVYFQFTLPAWGAIFFFWHPRVQGYFNSRSLRGERQIKSVNENVQTEISILAPCLGSDKSAMLHRRSFVVFNSRSPHGERSRLLSLFITALFFQFSLPAWRATKSICISKAPFYFSIHASHMGSSQRYPAVSNNCRIFNSRSPHGERFLPVFQLIKLIFFNSRSPYWER